MGDTLTHLDSPAEVERLFADVHAVLALGGVFALTFRLEAAGFALTHQGPAGRMVGLAATKRG
jgi:predicted methyltransferase